MFVHVSNVTSNEMKTLPLLEKYSQEIGIRNYLLLRKAVFKYRDHGFGTWLLILNYVLTVFSLFRLFHLFSNRFTMTREKIYFCGVKIYTAGRLHSISNDFIG